MLRLLLSFAISCLMQSAAVAGTDAPGGCNGAMKSSYQLRSWEAVHGYFVRYNGWCIDGAYGVGVSDSVTRLLANSWSTFPDFRSIAVGDPKFVTWVAGRLNGFPEDECAIVRAVENLEKVCVPESQSLCKTLARGGRKHFTKELLAYCASNLSAQSRQPSAAAGL